MTPYTHEFAPILEDRTMRTRALLWFTVLAGIVSWAVHLGLLWALASPVCSGGTTVWMHATTAIAALVTLAGLLVGISQWRNRPRSSATVAAASAAETNRFMALLGITSNILFLLLIALEGVGAFVLVPCAVS